MNGAYPAWVDWSGRLLGWLSVPVVVALSQSARRELAWRWRGKTGWEVVDR